MPSTGGRCCCIRFDRPPALVTADVAARARLSADAYGMTGEHRALVVPTALRFTHNVSLRMGAAAEADPVFRRWWDKGVRDRLRRTEAWLADEADRIETALRR